MTALAVIGIRARRGRLDNRQRLQIALNTTVTQMDSPCLFKLAQSPHTLVHQVIESLPVPTECDALNATNLELLNEFLDFGLGAKLWRDARKTNGAVGDGCLTAKILLTDLNNPSGLRHNHVCSEAGKEVGEDEVHPEIIGVGEIPVRRGIGNVPVRIETHRCIAEAQTAQLVTIMVGYGVVLEISLAGVGEAIMDGVDYDDREEEGYGQEFDGHLEEGQELEKVSYEVVETGAD